MIDEIKITIKCHSCDYSNKYDLKNIYVLGMEDLTFYEITKIYPQLICSNCRTKNPEIVKNDSISLINFPPRICSVSQCINPILIPRLKALENVNTCINCASGRPNFENLQIITNTNFIEDRIDCLKNLKVRCAEINDIDEFQVCKNKQIRDLAKLENISKSNIKFILGEDNLLFKNHLKNIIEILDSNKKEKSLRNADLITF